MANTSNQKSMDQSASEYVVQDDVTLRSNLSHVSRVVRETNFGAREHFELEFVTDIMLDNRAIGYRAQTIGGRESSFEPMAEVIVAANLESDLAAAMIDTEVLTRVFATVFPKSESSKVTVSASQGLIAMPMLISAYQDALSGDILEKRTLANVLAELTAHAIRHLNLVLPFDGVLSLSAHDTLFPGRDVIRTAARTARVAEVLEAMKLDPEIGRVKTLSAAALRLALVPMFARAGRLLLQTTEQDLDLDDSLLLLKWYVTRSTELPTTLIANDDLKALASNLTLVLASCQGVDRPLHRPEYDLRRVLSDSVLRLRGLKRFTTKHLSEVRDWYAHYTVVDQPGQRIIGLVFGRNVQLENRPQVTVFTQAGQARSPFWCQTPYPAAENRIEPLLTQLFAKGLHAQTMTAMASNIATYTWNGDKTRVLYTNGATDIELFHYAAAVSRGITLALGEDGYSIGYLNEDVEMNYDSKSYIVGSLVYSADPAEGVIHSGLRENAGSGAVTTRVQGIPDTNRTEMLIVNPDNFTNNLGTPFTVRIAIDDHVLSCETSLSDLLALPESLRLSVTQQLAAPDLINAHLSVLNYLAVDPQLDITTSAGQISRVRAATALSNFLLEIGASPSGRALVRAVMLKFVFSGSSDQEKAAIRGTLRNAQISYELSLRIGGEILVALGYAKRELLEASLELIHAERIHTFMVGSTPQIGTLL